MVRRNVITGVHRSPLQRCMRVTERSVDATRWRWQQSGGCAWDWKSGERSGDGEWDSEKTMERERSGAGSRCWHYSVFIFECIGLAFSIFASSAEIMFSYNGLCVRLRVTSLCNHCQKYSCIRIDPNTGILKRFFIHYCDSYPIEKRIRQDGYGLCRVISVFVRILRSRSENNNMDNEEKISEWWSRKSRYRVPTTCSIIAQYR